MTINGCGKISDEEIKKKNQINEISDQNLQNGFFVRNFFTRIRANV